MYCFFKTTTTTKRSFFEIKTINLQLHPNELQVIQDADELRNKITLGIFQVIPQYLQLFLNQLKPILSKQSLFHPQFTYEPMISNCQLKSPLNSQEAFETDYLMLIYTYCNGLLLDSFQQIKYIRQAIIEERPQNPKEIDIILEKMQIAHTFIKNAKIYFNQLFPNLCQRNTFDFEEFSIQFFFRYSTYFIVMINLFYYEKMREMNQDQVLTNQQNLCSTMLKLLIQLGNLGCGRLGMYLFYLSHYLKCLGYKSIIDRYLYKIEKEDYKEKSFIVMILEIIQLCQELKQISQTIILKEQIDEDYMDVFKIQAQRWITFSDLQIRIYQGITKSSQPIQSNEQILLNLGYFNCLD